MPVHLARIPAGPATPPAPAGPAQKNLASDPLQKACQDFESIFVSMVFRQALNATRAASENEVAGAGVFDMLGDQALAGHIARNGGFGIAAYLYRLLSSRSTEPILKAGEDGR